MKLGQRAQLDAIVAAMTREGYYINRRRFRDLPEGVYSIERDEDTGALELYHWQGDSGEQVGSLCHS